MEREKDDQMFAVLPGATRRPSWPALFLGFVPFVAICFTVGLWDRIYPTVAGVPFNISWLILWTLLTPLCMWGAYRCEHRKEAEDQHARHEDRR